MKAKITKINRPGYRIECLKCKKQFEGTTQDEVMKNFNIHFNALHPRTKEEASKPNKAESPYDNKIKQEEK
jgi:hypothetical protein